MSRFSRWILLALGLSLACGQAPDTESPPETPPIEDVTVFYGTDRARNEECRDARLAPRSDCDAVDFYGAEHSGELEVGTVTVSIPPGHQTGKIERPLSVWKVRFPEDPAKHVVMDEPQPVSRAPVGERESAKAEYREWQDLLGQTGLEVGFLYVHGYATSFEDATYRSGQVAYDLDYMGVPFLFSWPSQGTTSGYFTDGEVVELSRDAFIEFLYLVRESGIESLHVIAHSMGNRLVAKALESLVQGGEEQKLIAELVLAAPDIDAEIFREQFAEVLPRLARRVTLYVSDQDFALDRAEDLPRRPRAGQRAGGLLGLPGLDSIDASNLDLDFLAHSYYANNRNMLSDIYCVLAGSIAAQRPLLEEIQGPLGPAWKILPNETFADSPPSPGVCSRAAVEIRGSSKPAGEAAPRMWCFALPLVILIAVGLGIYLMRRT